jgi:hypothetical protein
MSVLGESEKGANAARAVTSGRTGDVVRADAAEQRGQRVCECHARQCKSGNARAMLDATAITPQRGECFLHIRSGRQRNGHALSPDPWCEGRRAGCGTRQGTSHPPRASTLSSVAARGVLAHARAASGARGDTPSECANTLPCLDVLPRGLGDPLCTRIIARTDLVAPPTGSWRVDRFRRRLGRQPPRHDRFPYEVVARPVRSAGGFRRFIMVPPSNGRRPGCEDQSRL